MHEVAVQESGHPQQSIGQLEYRVSVPTQATFLFQKSGFTLLSFGQSFALLKLKATEVVSF